MIRPFVKHYLPVVVDWAPHGLVSRILGSFTPIFMLHRIAEDGRATEGHGPALIERCLSYVRKHGYNPISLEAYGKLLHAGEPVPARSVVFTIDDGFKDQCVVAGEIFSKYDIPLTCFVITDFIDGRLWPWDDQISHVIENTPLQRFAVRLTDGSQWEVDLTDKPTAINRLRHRLKGMDQTGLYPWLAEFYLAAELDVPAAPPAQFQPASWSEANSFVVQGHCIAPHTCTHRILSRLSDSDSQREIVASAKRVKQQVPGASETFAYPTGRAEDFGERECAAAQAAGLSCAVSTLAATATPGHHRYALPRFPLPKDFFYFIQYLTYVEVVKERLLRRSRRPG